jgi:autotransporter-associated beta strand protein
MNLLKHIRLGHKQSQRTPVRKPISPVFRLRLEALEDRVVPATRTWDGGSTFSNNWSDRFNWVGDVAPVPGDRVFFDGDDLVFPAGARQLINVNDFPTDAIFNSVTFSGSGYTISAGSSRLDLGFRGITNSASSGTNSYDGPIRLDGDGTIEVLAGGTLHLGGALSGSGGISKTGPGVLTLDGAIANTYTGVTHVSEGLLLLDKGGPAIPGPLLIISCGFAEVRLLRANQIADNAYVNVARGSESHVLLNLNGFSDAIGALDLRFAGEVFTGGGVLTLNGDVTAQANQLFPSENFASAKIQGNLVLGATRTITVYDYPGTPLGLDIDNTTGGTLIKEGAGALSLSGSARITQVEANAGTLAVDGILSGDVILKNDALLTGSGQVSSSVSTQGGAARILDDGSPGFNATAGWGTVTGQGGFANNFLRAAPFAGFPGSPSLASWVFTGLTPGLYRVFATWASGSDRSTSAPYSIFDNTTLQATADIDQEKSPAGGPRSGGVAFQQLGVPVNITTSTLRVQLSNQVPSEQDGANVIADAVRIEPVAGTISGPSNLGSASLGSGSTYRVNFVSTAPGSNDVNQITVAGSFVSSGALLALSATSFSPPRAGTAYRIVTAGSFSGSFSNLPNNGDTLDLVVGTARRTFRVDYYPRIVTLTYLNTPPQVRDLELSPGVINEGERVTLRGALTDPDPGDVLSLRVDWGDRTAVQTFSDLGTNPFHFTHTYADNSPPGSPFLVRVEWFDQHGAGNFRKLFVTVNNVPPRLFLGGAEVVRVCEVMHHTGRFTDPGADTWRATVDYGDGSGVQPLAIQTGQTLFFEHRYQRPGTYHVTVSVFDDDGGVGADTFLVIVLPPLKVRRNALWYGR